MTTCCDSGPRFVRDTVNAGADLVIDWLSLSDRDNDLINLVVNASVYVAERGDATMEDVIRTNYDEDPDDVRAWWNW